MPIKDKSKYPPDWAAISHRIRFERAGGKCERCGVSHDAQIVRSVIDPSRYVVFDETTGGVRWPDGRPIRASEEPDEFAANEKVVRVVLTVAHLDHNPANNEESNLAALCQRCHLQHDAKEHSKHAAATRRDKRDAASGQLKFL